jgi:hypothetical protein
MLKSVSPQLEGLCEVVFQSPDAFDEDLWQYGSGDKVSTAQLWYTSISCVFTGLLSNLDRLETIRVATWLGWATGQRPLFFPLPLVQMLFLNGGSYSSLIALHLGFMLEESRKYRYGKRYHRSAFG